MPIAAGVVRDLGIAASRVLAACDMPAERRGATALDRTHHLQLLEAHMPAVGLAPGRTVISHLCQQRSYRYPPAIRARTLNANSSGTAQARVHRSGLGVPRNATVMAIRSSRARTRRSIGSEST